MSDSKHTPGPWRTDDHGNIVCYPEGLSVGVLSRQLPEGELKANHLLIVAAPDLLDACHKVVNNWSDLHPKDLAQLRAAIAKAGG